MKEIKRSIVLKPPASFVSLSAFCERSIFLAGSIEMGKAIEWQKVVEEALSSYNIAIFNPRRDDWDSSWKQEIGNKQFYEQVNWELTGLEKADVIAMFFADDTKSPISLLELGIWAGKEPNKLVVYCTDKFYRKGNVDIVCQRYGIPVHENVDTWILNIKNKLGLI